MVFQSTIKRKKMTIYKILVGFAFFCFPQTHAQTNRHVATTGSDVTGTGTLANSFKTIQKAADIVQPGDTVFVHQGTYRNADFNDGDIWGGDNLVKITANGNADNYITFMPFPGDQVLLESDSNYNILLKNASYIQIIGFEAKGNGDMITQAEADAAWGLYKDSNGTVHDLAIELGIDINDPALRGTTLAKPPTPNIKKPSYYNGRGIVASQSYHIIIKNNIVHDMTGSAIRADKSDYVTITNNEVYHNTYWTSAGVGAITVAEATVTPSNDTFTGVKIKLLKNNVHHNENRLISWAPSKTIIKMVIDEGTGLFLTRNQDTYTQGKILIANNISSFNGASGIVCHKTDRAIIEHNTCYKNGTTNDSAAGGIGVNNADNVIIRNNISYAEPDHWALGKLGGTLTNITISNNILYNENGTQAIHKNMPNGWTEENPLLTNPENGDFTLSQNSPAIDAGNSTSTIIDDIVGNLRNDGLPDIGAYEFISVLNVEEVQNRDIKMYPNPTTGKIFLSGAFENLNKIKIYDQTGRIVLTKIITKNTNLISLNLSHVSSGLYYLKTDCCVQPVIKK
jgi:parallel beta-helix repeat protein